MAGEGHVHEDLGYGDLHHLHLLPPGPGDPPVLLPPGGREGVRVTVSVCGVPSVPVCVITDIRQHVSLVLV